MMRTLTQCSGLATVLLTLAVSSVICADEPAAWKTEAAAKYLDGRANEWFAFPSANRGGGATQSSCVSCHTLFPYALARPVLRKSIGATSPTELEQKIRAQTATRVEGWAQLDTAKFGLFYEFNDTKKKESWGTEAVLNALILAFDDRSQGRTTPSDVTKRAFANLWQAQAQAGDQKGSWDWLDFNLEPLESKEARYVGAALAAVAVGTAPGLSATAINAAPDANVALLRGYLKGGAAARPLHSRLWALWASVKLDGVLTKDEQKTIIAALLEKQQADGGWRLSSLGPYVRSDNTTQDVKSDGYATGLVVHVVLTAGVPKTDANVSKGLAWLRANQAATGGWRGVSVNKNRNPATHVGKFMSDAATAFAILALSHE